MNRNKLAVGMTIEIYERIMSDANWPNRSFIEIAKEQSHTKVARHKVSTAHQLKQTIKTVSKIAGEDFANKLSNAFNPNI